MAEADRRRLGDAIGARHTHQWWAGRSRRTHADAARLTRLGTALTSTSTPGGASPGRGSAAGRAGPGDRRGSRRTPGPCGRRRRVARPKRPAGRSPSSTTPATSSRSASGSSTWWRPRWPSPTRLPCWRRRSSRALAAVELTLRDDGEGRCHGRFTVPSHVGAMFTRHLLALANPARHTEAELRDESGEWKPLRRRLGEAFVEYVERYPTDATPQTAGVNATVVVTMTLEQLLGEHATALLDDGSRMTAGQARRLACEAGIIPVVLGTKSQPLDLGRAAPSVHQGPAHRPRPPRRRLHRPRLRDHRLRLPRPPRRPLVARRSHRPRQRAAAVSAPSPAGT